MEYFDLIAEVSREVNGLYWDFTLTLDRLSAASHWTKYPSDHQDGQ
jgi:hypothetical protein